ncbi:hypothetical protein IPG41_03360 [Candidatus Peregrinibacteria bacterium]|nr:MAG: hypothetical protein IPG41_03360 [Candidatus Peregrinibacteria bacterium]
MDKNEIQNDFKSNFLQLRKIINAWNLIPGSGKEEFDSLNQKILSNLYRGADADKIKRVIESELCVNFGFFIDEFDSEKMSLEIIEWWNE